MKRQPNLRVDRVFPGVGRINLVSGATTKAEHKKRDALLTELYDTGRLELLRAIKRRRLTINEVYGAQRAGRLGFVASDVVLRRNVWDGLDGWLPQSAKAPASRTRNGVSVRFLKRTGVLAPGATIADLAATDWTALHNQNPIGPTGWNHLRRMVSRFLTMTLKGKHHPFRHEVLDGFPIAKEHPPRVPDLTPERFWTILEHVDPPLRPYYVTLVATGMRPGEYLRCQETDLLPHTRGVKVPGSKTASSTDVVRLDGEAWDWVKQAIPCPVSYHILYSRWKKACAAVGQPDLRLHDLRHAHAQWLSERGIPEARIQTAMRHRTASMTRRYARQVDKGETARTISEVLFHPAICPATASSDGEKKVG